MLTTTATAAAAVAIPSDALVRIRQLYSQGLYLQALALGQEFAPLRDWRGAAARVLAGRLAINLGAPRLCFWHQIWAWREDPRDPEVCYFYARTMLDRRGPLTIWKFLRSCGDQSEAPPGIRADWYALHACVAGRVRDFVTAETWLAKAEQLSPERPWICIERATLLEFEDRYEEALAAARQALARHAWYRPGVQAVAHYLQLLDRDEEALALLREADQRMESCLITAQLALLQTELGHYADARRSYDRFADLSPVREKAMDRWLAARRSETAYLAGDVAQAIEHARKAEDDSFCKEMVERLTRVPLEGRRHLLPVGFVRQHHKTCAPATLAALSRFWSMPAEHLEIAAAICYDGTPAFSERRWAEEHGWAVREFTVTWESAVAVLDRGVPFTLTLTEPTFAHLQAAIGYDSCRRTLLVRDPYQRYFGEYPVEPFLQRYRATGPRGMALVPQQRAELLDGLDLPDAGWYDQIYQLHQALDRHHRERAQQVYEAMKAAAPEHRLTWHAHRVLAIYDASPTEMLASVEGLLKLFPDDGLLQLSRINCLRDLARREERLNLLADLSARPASDPVFRLIYAQELSADAREDRRTLRLLRWVVRVQPNNANALSALAHLLWAQRHFDDGLTLYRWAACLEATDERLAQTYFTMARSQGQTDVALAFLKDRFARFGARSSLPGRTLFWAYSLLEEWSVAFDVLDTTLKLRPDDGDLLLFAAEVRANHGEMNLATGLLATAEGRCPRTAWLRTAAWLAVLQGERERALALWRDVLAVEPLALDAHRSLVRLLAESDRRAEALEHLKQICNRFPHHYALHQLWIDWLHTDGPAAAEAAVRRLVEIHPADSWARRELALTLANLGRLAEAFQELEIAHGLDPTSPWHWCTRGQLCTLAGRADEAREAFRQALCLMVDCDAALRGLIAACDTLAERREALTFVEAELERQVTLGDILLTYHEVGRTTLEADDLLALLRKVQAARPDLWHAWSALIRQLIATNHLEEAHALAQQATARFPLLPALWLDQAEVCEARKDTAGEIEAIQRALQINPSWGMASRHLAAAYQRSNRLAEARTVLEAAVERAPLDYLNHGCLADLLWQMDEKEPALERLQQALRLAPASYDWAWRALADWTWALERPEVAVQFARTLTEQRAGEAYPWLMLARMLSRPEDLDEQLTALDRAVAINPHYADAYDLRADLLARAGRFDEALAACAAPVWDGRPPLFLRGRGAWVEVQRGRIREGIAAMRALVAEDPAYYWGWTQLTEWHRQHGTPAEYRAAADQRVRLAPQDPVSLGLQGEARLRTGDRAGAKEAYRRALEIAPDYAFGGYALFDLHMEDDELKAAEETLEILEKHVQEDAVTACAVQLAARRKDKKKARKLLRRLCTRLGADGWPLEAATTAMVQAGWSSAAEEVFARTLDDPDVVPHVGALWVQRCLERGWWDCATRIPELLRRGEIGHEALIAYLRGLGETGQKEALHRCIQRYRDVCRTHTRTWGMVGYALATIDDYQEARHWLADYAQREELESWMLLNLVIALRATNADEEAARVSQRALELPPDRSTAYHHTWLTLDAALAGSRDVRTMLDRVVPADLDPTHRFLRSLVEGLLAVQEAEPAARGRVFAEVRVRWRRAAVECSPLVQDRPAVRRAYRRCVRRLARDCGGLLAVAWAAYRWLFPLMPNPA